MRSLALIALLSSGCSLVASSEVRPERCEDGIDNDLDGRVDCADVDCTAACPNGLVDEPDLLGTCRGTWRSSREGAHCEPWPEAEAMPCPPYEFRSPNDERCRPVGDGPCQVPTSALLPANAFVDEHAEAAGDGSLEQPYASLAEAIDRAEPGTTITFVGAFEVPTPLTKSLTLLGVCPSESKLTGEITTTAARLRIADLALENPSGTALRVLTPADAPPEVMVGAVFIEDAVIRGRVEVGDGGGAFIERSAIRGAIEATDAMVVFVDGSELAPEEAEACIEVDDSGALPTISLRDVALFDCEVAVQDADLSVYRSVFERSRVTTASSPGANFVAEDSLFRRVSGDREPSIRLMGSADLTGSVFIGGSGPAVSVSGGSTRIDDCSFLRQVGGPALAISGGTVDMARVAAEGYTQTGIELGGGELDARQLILRGAGTTDSTAGVVAAEGTLLQLDDFLFEDPGACAFRLARDVMVDVKNGTIDTLGFGFCVPPDSYERNLFVDQISQRAGQPVVEGDAD